jgi:8-oxo-dGTP pyrophosphatase MutT (NUDIX family)
MGLAESLAVHAPADADEAGDLERIRDFVARHERPFDRGIREGHLTGSALVVSAAGERTLLLFHGKLSRWVQPGGHADREEDSGEAVALREALEETGIAGLALHPSAPRPLDVDVHTNPAREDEPAHEHHDQRWFGWEELASLDLDAGLRRALDKARRIAASSDAPRSPRGIRPR